MDIAHVLSDSMVIQSIEVAASTTFFTTHVAEMLCHGFASVVVKAQLHFELHWWHTLPSVSANYVKAVEVRGGKRMIDA